MKLKGFTSVEILTVVAVMAVLAGLSMPLVRNFLLRSDLHTAAEQTTQMLRRARILAQSGDRGSWGVYIPDGVLYQGESFPSRDMSLDEFLPLPSSVSVSNIQDVSFSALDGAPSATGTILLESSNVQSISIAVTPSLVGSPELIPQTSDASFKVEFIRVDNRGAGYAEPTVHVGQPEVIYQSNEWIPLHDDGNKIIDSGIHYDTAGIAVQRMDGVIRFLNYGVLTLQRGKEIIDARITLKNATISDIVNDTGGNKTEYPFDGWVFDWAIGDEITQESRTEVLFQTRVTTLSDGFFLHWTPD